MAEVFKIFGPPGTGKTKTLLDIVEKELKENCTPDDIAFLTFTVKARIEAITRASQLLKVDSKKFPYFSTLHSIAWKVGGFQNKNKMTTKHWFEFGNLMKQHRVTGDTDIKVDKTQSEMGGEIASNKYISLINKARQQRLRCL
jgi:superfamily I DNA/RNA helicase